VVSDVFLNSKAQDLPWTFSRC